MKSVVLDTSAIIHLYIPDGELPAGLTELLEQAAGGDVALMVPDLALVEIAQVLRKKELANFLTAAESDEILDAVLARDRPPRAAACGARAGAQPEPHSV